MRLFRCDPESVVAGALVPENWDTAEKNMRELQRCDAEQQ